jgi:hypothetical protein
MASVVPMKSGVGVEAGAGPLPASAASNAADKGLIDGSAAAASMDVVLIQLFLG